MTVDGKSKEELVREVAELRRQLEELKVVARRYHAMVDSAVSSVVVYDSAGRPIEANKGFEAIWQLPFAALANYVVFEDKQLEPTGVMAGIRHAYATGEATKLPVVRYDPTGNEGMNEGRAGWVAAGIYPVKNEAGEIVEAVVVHNEIGELKQSEDELRAQNEALEAAVAERTRELSEHLRLLKEQQQAILELSTPVIRLWEGILALPLIGMIDTGRAAQIMENLLAAIVRQRASQVILDVTGVPVIDTGVASHLFKTVGAAALLGAQCILVGISPEMAQTLVHLELDFSRLSTAATLEDGLRQALARTNHRIVATPRAGKAPG